MRRPYTSAYLILLTLTLASAISAQQPSPSPSPTLDPNDPIARIREEGLTRSHVMETLSYLTDVIGPRLTGSPNMKRANDWTRDQLAKWGLQNAHLESWGPFGRGWALKSFLRGSYRAAGNCPDRVSQGMVTRSKHSSW